MTLDNMMEDTQLNFNQPFLTVRRFSPTVASAEGQDKRRTDKSLPTIPPLPPYKSEVKSGPVRNPGTVPFVWEQCPGRPKNESQSQTRTPDCPPAAPKLPPGRIARVKQQDSEKTSDGVRGVRSQTRNMVLNSENAQSSDEGAKKNETTEEKGFGGSDYGDEAYLDALDTFSRSESFSLNCSVSGLSGGDGSDMRLSGRFSRDPPARDFMMGRFLPAAKAMASEAPLHFIRKQSVAQDQPRHPVKKAVVVGENRQLEVLKPIVLPMAQVGAGEESEDDYYESEASTTNGCGLFPRFCLLNPVPGMRTQTVGLTAHKTQVNSTHANYQGESRSKHNKKASDEQRSVGGHLIPVLQENKFDLKSTQSQTTCRNYDKKLEGSSLYGRLQGNGKFQHQNGFPKSVVQEQERSVSLHENVKNSKVKASNSQEKRFVNLRELLASERAEWGPDDSTSPMVEKTVYVDTVQAVKSQGPTNLSDEKELSYSEGDVFEIKATSKKVDEAILVDSSSLDIEDIEHLEKKTISELESVHFPHSPSLSSSDRLDQVINIDLSRHDQALTLAGIKETSSKVGRDGKIDLEKEALMRLGDQQNPSGAYSPLPLPPPLPKSPSDSWLSRALPSVASKKPSSQSSLGANVVNGNHASESAPVDPKWETIVKSSNVHHGHLRFSEELLPPIPET